MAGFVWIGMFLMKQTRNGPRIELDKKFFFYIFLGRFKAESKLFYHLIDASTDSIKYVTSFD